MQAATTTAAQAEADAADAVIAARAADLGSTTHWALTGGAAPAPAPAPAAPG